MKVADSVAKPILEWAHTTAMKRVWDLLHEGVAPGLSSSQAYPRRRERVASRELHEILRQNDKAAPPLNLLDVAAPNQERLRTRLVAEEPWPSDFSSYLTHVREKALGVRAPQGAPVPLTGWTPLFREGDNVRARHGALRRVSVATQLSSQCSPPSAEYDCSNR